MVRIWCLLALVIATLALSGAVRAAGLGDVTTRQLNALNPVSLERYLENLGHEYPSAPSVSLAQIVSDLAHRKNPVSLSALGNALLEAVGGDLLREGRILGLLLVLTVVGAVLARLADAFAGREVAEVANLVVLAALIGVAVSSFGVAVGTVSGMIDGVVHLMEASIPAVLVLMAGSGALASAGMVHPLLMLTVNLVALAAKGFVLPLVLLAVIVEVIAAWMPRYRLAQLANLLKQVAIFSLGGLLSLFLAVCAMENVAGRMADGLALRTGKFLANAFLPVVGKMFSDAMDVVLRSSGLLLGALGMTIGLALIVTVMFPVLKVLVMLLMFRLGAAGAEPLGVEGVTKTLTVMANGLGLLVSVAAAVGLMFFLVVTVVVASTSGVAP
ncbi:MAG: stage III sporulation protein AE [Clostridia bacterium]